jgi:hypothetical protein
MILLRRATSGFHQHGFRAEQVPNRPTHAAAVGGSVALCGASVAHVFVRGWGVSGPEVNGCKSCRREAARRAAVVIGS